ALAARYRTSSPLLLATAYPHDSNIFVNGLPRQERGFGPVPASRKHRRLVRGASVASAVSGTASTLRSEAKGTCMRFVVGLFLALSLPAFAFGDPAAPPTATGDAPAVKLLEPKPLTPGHKVVTLFPPGHPALKAGPGSD